MQNFTLDHAARITLNIPEGLVQNMCLVATFHNVQTVPAIFFLGLQYVPFSTQVSEENRHQALSNLTFDILFTCLLDFPYFAKKIGLIRSFTCCYSFRRHIYKECKTLVQECYTFLDPTHTPQFLTSHLKVCSAGRQDAKDSLGIV
jgi:hypothetical protein